MKGLSDEFMSMRGVFVFITLPAGFRDHGGQIKTLG